MIIQAEKLELIRWLISLKDKTILEKLVKLKDKAIAESDWWDELSEAEQASIERGLKDIEEGRITPHSDAKGIYEQWL